MNLAIYPLIPAKQIIKNDTEFYPLNIALKTYG